MRNNISVLNNNILKKVNQVFYELNFKEDV